MKLNQCVQCGNNSLSPIQDTIETTIDGKILVIPNINALQCLNCNEIYYDVEANRYIDKQIAIFKANGFENKIKEIRKQKGLSQEQLGDRLGLTKQRVGQIEQDTNLDVRTMYRLSEAVEEPIQNLFTFNQVIQKDNKFYISN